MKTGFDFIIRNSVAFGMAVFAGVQFSAPTSYAQQPEAAEIRSESGASVSTTRGSATSDVGTATGYRIQSSSQNGEGAVTRVFKGDRIVATYHADLEGTPGFYPLLSPAGLPLTRNFPMKPFGAAKENSASAARFENHDHPHHRSMWFDHGDVNGIDFWALKNPSGKVGRVVQRSEGSNVVQLSSLTDGVEMTSEFCELITENDWIGPDDQRVLSDQREFRFQEHLGDTIMDVTIRLIASDGDVTFGDTKEGSLGVRVAGTMKVDAKLGGEINNAEGLKDDDTWAKVSSWVDYSGPIAPTALPEGDAKLTATDTADWARAGITMMYHPANALPECYWHVRTYGLFAANPFGRHHFGAPAYDGVEIKDGESLTLRFRLVMHDGGFDQEKTQQHFEAYASESVE